MAGVHEALRVRGRVRRYALGLPEAYEAFPWGESVAKVAGKVFVFLGSADGSHGVRITLKLTGVEAHEHALSMRDARPAGYGLGRAGWVSLALDVEDAPLVDLLTDWGQESYRVVAPKRLVALLDAAETSVRSTTRRVHPSRQATRRATFGLSDAPGSQDAIHGRLWS